MHGATSARGLARTPSSSLAQGRFGRLFRNLPVFAPGDEEARVQLRALAARMAAAFDPSDVNPDIPSGYTYLG
ncbi:MAG TPA: heme peroxidase, partial [Myxococcota bacterium]|nr:heme peroxidase [Myxococcota bacterium]